MDDNLLTARFFFVHKDGGDILAVNDRQYLDTIRLKRDSYDKTQFLEIGHIIDLEDVAFKVVGINLNLLNEPINFPSSEAKYNLAVNVFLEHA